MATLKLLKPQLSTLNTSSVPALKSAPNSARARKQDGRGSPYDRREWRDRISPDKLRANPLCEECEAHGKVVPAREVDHIDGNPENNDPKNLRSLCAPCHSRKTAQQDGGFGLQPSGGKGQAKSRVS